MYSKPRISSHWTKSCASVILVITNRADWILTGTTSYVGSTMNIFKNECTDVVFRLVISAEHGSISTRCILSNLTGARLSTVYLWKGQTPFGSITVADRPMPCTSSNQTTVQTIEPKRTWKKDHQVQIMWYQNIQTNKGSLTEHSSSHQATI